jgi:hypothetical protein
VRNRFQAFASKCNLHRYKVAALKADRERALADVEWTLRGMEVRENEGGDGAAAAGAGAAGAGAAGAGAGEGAGRKRNGTGTGDRDGGRHASSTAAVVVRRSTEGIGGGGGGPLRTPEKSTMSVRSSHDSKLIGARKPSTSSAASDWLKSPEKSGGRTPGTNQKPPGTTTTNQTPGDRAAALEDKARAADFKFDLAKVRGKGMDATAERIRGEAREAEKAMQKAETGSRRAEASIHEAKLECAKAQSARDAAEAALTAAEREAARAAADRERQLAAAREALWRAGAVGAAEERQKLHRRIIADDVQNGDRLAVGPLYKLNPADHKLKAH